METVRDFILGGSKITFGEGNGTPLQYSCLGNSMDGGAWWATVHGIAKSRTQLSEFTLTFHSDALEKEMATHSSVLACRIPGTEEPGRLPSLGSHRVGHDWNDLAAAAAAKITVDGDYSHEIKRCLLLGWKAVTNLDSILKSRDITLQTNVHLVKAIVFPVVMYGCESSTLKKAEPWRIDTFELWCWRRLLRVPWTARRSNQSILREISPEHSLEGLMLMPKL